MIEDQKQALTELLTRALSACGLSQEPIRLERPKQAGHGDLASTIALQCAKKAGKNPRELAAALVEAMKQDAAFSDILSDVEIAGPGFINFRFSQEAKVRSVRDVLRQGSSYGTSKAFEGKSVLLEYVSANPTGPLHLGHARQGALGDVLSRIMATQGYRVMREFYYNDAGVQIGNLALSVQIRCRQLQGEAVELPENAYHGEYILSIAKDFLEKKPVHAHSGETVESTGDASDTDLVRRYAVAYLRNEQDDDLQALGVHFDNFFLESSLYSRGLVRDAVDAMIASGNTYEADGALWLRTTAFDDLGNGLKDDKDRVMQKADGTFTYFVPDVAYHLNKWSRGFDKAINIQGTDHHGTIARVRAGLQAVSGVKNLNIPKLFPEYILHKMLSVVKDGEPVKMSKRSGNYVTLRDLVDWAGRDAARYFLVARKADAEFVFDVTLAQQKSDENPVYYVQYAHARISSVFAGAAAKGWSVPSEAELADADLSALSSESALSLIGTLVEFPAALAQAARDQAPHILCYYLKDLAASIHAFYNAERVLVEDEKQRTARLALLAAARRVLKNGLTLLGISAPDLMERREESEGPAA